MHHVVVQVLAMTRIFIFQRWVKLLLNWILAEKNKISHRGQALRQLLAILSP
jgi:inosine/xanthosine triphosphate pyrophosphatase family protein